MDDGQSEDRPRQLRAMGIKVLAGLAAGLPVGWLVGRFMKMHKIETVSWSDDGALAIAITFLVSGGLVIFLTIGQRGRAILANPGAPEYDRTIRADQVVFFRLQAGVLLLAGLLLGLPVVAALIDRQAAAVHGTALMIAVLVGFATQSALNLMIWRRADEVYRQVIAESGAASFWLLQGVFFLWACGVKLQVLPEISSWDAVTVLMGVYLIMSTVAAYRRGLG